jgi:hypothetical protein
MLTPKQQTLLKHPNVQLLIKTLQCEPILSEEFKYSKKVQDRITNLIQTFEKAQNLPVVKRSVSVQGDCTTQGERIDCGASIEAEYIIKSWKSAAGKKIKCIF